jgi:hypothetical protein
MLRALIAVAGLAVLVPGVANAAQQPPGAARPPQCGLIAFATQGEDGAFQIAARDISCSLARTVADASRPSRFRHGDPRYTELGFACMGRSEQLGGHGKQVVAFECVRDRSYVSFLRG